MASTADLRREFPALALVAGFVAPQKRGEFADLLLLWLEGRRALRANENMVAAIRLGWWRDALRDQAPQSVPLAMRLLAHKEDWAGLVADLDAMIGALLGGGAVLGTWHRIIAEQLAANLGGDTEGGDTETIAKILGGFDTPSQTDNATNLPPNLHQAFRLMRWLQADRHRLNYPDENPLLALKMLWAVLLRRI